MANDSAVGTEYFVLRENILEILILFDLHHPYPCINLRRLEILLILIFVFCFGPQNPILDVNVKNGPNPSIKRKNVLILLLDTPLPP